MNRTNLKVRHILDDIPTKEEFQEVIEKVKLTPRQLEILELRFIRHLLNYEIADRAQKYQNPSLRMQRGILVLIRVL